MLPTGAGVNGVRASSLHSPRTMTEKATVLLLAAVAVDCATRDAGRFLSHGTTLPCVAGGDHSHRFRAYYRELLP